MRSAVAQGRAGYVPCLLSEIPLLMRRNIMRPNIALLNLSPPDKHGFCSLGTEVCTAFPAAETADMIIAQINPRVPRTCGNSYIHMRSIDYAVYVDEPLAVNESHAPTVEEGKIGEYIASLVCDGATLQMGIGGIPNAVLGHLRGHKDLGIHTGIFGPNGRNVSGCADTID